jgi:hypothetical protein
MAPTLLTRWGGAGCQYQTRSLTHVCFQRLTPKCDESLSNVGFNFNVRRYNQDITGWSTPALLTSDDMFRELSLSTAW